MDTPDWKVEVLLAGSWRGATSVLLSSARHHIVVDTGMAHEAPQLIQGLANRGLRPGDIDTVINTHFHIDHALNNSLFTNSAIYASQASIDWCQSLYSDVLDDAHWEKLVLKYYPETFDYDHAREHMVKLRKIALRWWDAKRLGQPSQFRWIENQALPEGLESVITWGHVPGHVSLIVHGAAGPAIVAGDALLSRNHDAQVLTMIPHNREQYRHDRALILSLGGRILPGHGQEFSNRDTAGN